MKPSFFVLLSVAAMFVLFSSSCNSSKEPSNQTKQATSAMEKKQPAMDKSKPVESEKKKEAPMVESIFDTGSGPSADELAQRAEIEFGKGNFDMCAKLFEQAERLDPNQDLFFYNGLFHCKYQAKKLDYTKGEIPEEVKKELVPIAEKITSRAKTDLDYLIVAISWMMLQDRKHCADAVTEMTNYMLNSERDLTDKQIAQLKEETKNFYNFIMDPKTSFADIAGAFQDILGFSEEEIKQQVQQQNPSDSQNPAPN